MYCPFCGKAIPQDSVYCNYCGKNPKESNNDQCNDIPKLPAMKSNVFKKLMPVSLGAIAIIILALLIINAVKSPLKLKYEWGTHYTTIKESEIVLDLQKATHMNTGAVQITLVCEDINHDADGIDELASGHKVWYRTNEAGLLWQIYYPINDELSVTEKVDILIDHYGSNYYKQDYNRVEAHRHHYWWWVEDTVIELYHNDLYYYDSEYILNSRSYRELCEYFNKS